MTRNNHIKAQETLNFLNDHPAIGGFIFPALSLLELSIVEVCKRGYCKPQRGCISIYHNTKNYRRFKAEFDKEFEGYNHSQRRFEWQRSEIGFCCSLSNALTLHLVHIFLVWCIWCIKKCPAHNITLDEKIIIGNKCQYCFRCVAVCPVMATFGVLSPKSLHYRAEYSNL
jgi:ferredoxin